jgi:hypothetical protein
MIKLFNNRLLLLICFILSIGLLSSCEKDDETSTQVELLSFGPTGAKHGDTLRFIGNNLNKVTEIQFTGKNAVVAQKDFKLQTNEEIKVIVPTTAEQGVVTLKTPEGNLVSKSKLNLGVEAVVTSVTAEARPGTNITITGDYLNWVKRVTFARDKVVSSFVSQSQNELVLTVPEDAQTGSLMIFYGGTDSMEVETDQILNVTLPAITGIAPTPVRHESNVTITGTNLDLVKEVIFSGVSTPVTAFESKTATQLVVKVPRSTTKGKITLKVASGVTVQSSTDLDVVLPVITNMTPNPVDPGANLTITGTNLDLVKGISFVGVTNEVTTFVSKSATQIVVTVPTGSAVPPIIIYDDVTTAAWNGWTGNGWGGTKDVNNTSPVRSGSKSVKIDYTSGGYGVPWQLGGANISLGGYTSLKVSIYGGAGSNGKSVNIGFNEQDGKTVTLVEGQWTDFTIPLSQISTTSTLTHLYIKNYSATGAFTIYVDNLGLY